MKTASPIEGRAFQYCAEAETMLSYSPNMTHHAASTLSDAPLLDCPSLEQDERYSLGRVLAMASLAFGCMLPVTMLVPALKELVAVRYGASAFWTHSFMSINMIGAILAAPLISRTTDSGHHRRRIAALALAADAVLLSLMGFAPNLATLLAIRFVEGAAHILAISTLMAVASSWSDPGRRGRTMGIVGGLMMFGTATGTRLGGVVWQHMPGWTFPIAGLIAAALAILSLAFVSEPSAVTRDPRRRPGLVRLVQESPRILIAFAYAFIDRFCVGVVITTFGLFLADVHGLNPAERSILLVWFLLPFAALVFPAGWLVDRVGRVWPISLGSIAFGLLFATYGVLPLAYMKLAMAGSGILSAIMFAPNLTLCADLAPPSRRGAAFAGFNIAGSIGFVVGPLFAGAAYSIAAAHTGQRAAYETTFVFAGLAEVLCGLFTLPVLLRMRRAGVTQ